MNITYLTIILLLGLAIGSFLNVIVSRIDNLKTIWNTRSHCPKCKEKLHWYDLIPVLSYLLLAGRCRYCKEKISLQYPLVEIATGFAFVFLFINFGQTLALLYYLIMFSLLLVIFVIDLKTQTVPEEIAWIALILAVLLGWYFGNLTIPSMIWGGVVSGGFLALLVYASGEKWMGKGDIKIGAIMGFLVGYPVAIIALFFAFILGAIVGLIYIKLRHKSIKSSLPFAPFLIVSTLLALTYGQYLLNWYWNLYIY